MPVLSGWWRARAQETPPLDRCHLAGLTWHCSPKLEALSREGYIAFARLENVLVARFKALPLSLVSWNEVKRWLLWRIS